MLIIANERSIWIIAERRLTRSTEAEEERRVALLVAQVRLRAGGKPFARIEGVLLLLGFVAYEYLLFVHG